MFKKSLSFLVLAAIALPAGFIQAASYTPSKGQSIAITKPGIQSANVNARMVELRSISAQTFGISVFGSDYAVDITAAQLQGADEAPTSLSSFTIGGRVDVFGTLDPVNTNLIHARVVRDTAAAGTPPPGDGGGNDDGGILEEEDSESILTNALYDYAKTGVKSTLPEVIAATWQRSINDWNKTGGSQNLPLIAEAATGDYKFFESLARLERQEGLYGREFGSHSYYFSFPFAAKMVALRDARRAGDTAAANEIASSMQATLALWSLVAVPTPRTSETLNEAGKAITGPGNASRYQGLSVAVAGERWKSRIIGGIDTDMILSWALDVPRGITGSAGNLKKAENNPKWWNNTIAQVVGVDSYSQTTDPAAWGLTADSRAKMQSLARGETTHLNWAISLIREYGVWKNSPVRLRRTSQGVETVYFNSSNGNKPAQAATSITSGGAWSGLKPCTGPSIGNNKGYKVTVAAGVITATGDAPNCTTVTKPELGGAIIYEVMINGKNVTSGANQAPPPASGGPTGEGGGNTDATNDTSKAYDLIRELLDLRKTVKARTFDWQPHRRGQIPLKLAEMQRKIVELSAEVSPFSSNRDTKAAFAEVQLRFTEFAAAAGVPVFPTPGHVPGPYKKAVERTAGRLDHALKKLRDTLPVPVGGDGGGGSGGGSEDDVDTDFPDIPAF